MDYFEVLGLAKEPFMDTADPYFFHTTPDREEILTRLEVAVRVGRGLSIVLGDVGSGKTTLAQTLEQNLLQDEAFVLGKIIDPSFSSEFLFLTQIAMIFKIEYSTGNLLELKNAIKNFLYTTGVEEKKTILLIIDEAQKLSEENLETLRILLNYQAPDRKLLNIILFGQPELMEQMNKRPNLVDRISCFFFLSPLDKKGTHELIGFRLRQAGLPDDREIFNPEAKDRIYEFSGGNVRKIVNLCHELIEELVIQEKSQVTVEMVERSLDKRKELDRFFLLGTRTPSGNGHGNGHAHRNGKPQDEGEANLENGLEPIAVRTKQVRFSGFLERILDKIWN